MILTKIDIIIDILDISFLNFEINVGIIGDTIFQLLRRIPGTLHILHVIVQTFQCFVAIHAVYSLIAICCN